MGTTATGLPNTFFPYGRNNIVHLNQTSSWFTKVFQGCETFINNSNLINIGSTHKPKSNHAEIYQTKLLPTYFWYLKRIPNSCRVWTMWGHIPALLLILDMDELAECIKQSAMYLYASDSFHLIIWPNEKDQIQMNKQQTRNKNDPFWGFWLESCKIRGSHFFRSQ